MATAPTARRLLGESAVEPKGEGPGRAWVFAPDCRGLRDCEGPVSDGRPTTNFLLSHLLDRFDVGLRGRHSLIGSVAITPAAVTMNID